MSEMNKKMSDLKVRMAKDHAEFLAMTEVVKVLLTLLPDEAVVASATKKLDKAYKHRVKSNKRLLEALEITNPNRGERDE